MRRGLKMLGRFWDEGAGLLNPRFLLLIYMDRPIVLELDNVINMLMLIVVWMI